MFKYWTKIENNQYVLPLLGKLAGRGYDGVREHTSYL